MPIGPFRTRRGQVALVAVLAVAAGAVAAPQVYSMTTGPDGTVAVVELEGNIDGPTAQFVEDELREARHNDSIEAVVLEVDSGGGLPAESERIYAAVERTAGEMPVIAAVDTVAASGAYLAMAPADDIYVAPSAQAIGSVGVTGPAPQPLQPSPGDTGPNKGSAHPDQDRLDRQVLAELFLESVMTQRGDEIELDRDEVARADIYLGTEAVENGLADEMGFVDDAIAEAAHRADLDSYEVLTQRTDLGDDPLLGLPIEDETDEPVVADRSDGTLNENFVLAVAPQFWDEAVASDVEPAYHSGDALSDGEDGTAGNETVDGTGGEGR